MRETKKIMIYSRDPGAANCVMPVFKLLAELPEYKIDLIGKDFSLKKYADNVLRAEDLSSLIPKIAYLSVKEFLKTKHYDLIFSGVGSDDFTNLPLLRNYSKTGLPMILSCGMSNLSEIYLSLSEIKALDGYPTILMLCTSQYPTSPEDVNLNKFMVYKYFCYLKK